MHVCDTQCYNKQGQRICGHVDSPHPTSPTVDLMSFHSWSSKDICLRCGHSKDYCTEESITKCPKGDPNAIITVEHLKLMEAIRLKDSVLTKYQENLILSKEKLSNAISAVESLTDEINLTQTGIGSVTSELMELKRRLIKSLGEEEQAILSPVSPVDEQIGRSE